MKCSYLLLLVLAACHPRIYEYSVSRTILGINDSDSISWRTKGMASLKIHDGPVPYQPGPPIQPLTLLVTRDGHTDSYTLRALDTLVLRLSEKGSLTLRKQPDGDTAMRYRNVRLVVYKYNEDSTRDTQIALAPAEFLDSIGFLVDTSGNDLVAAGETDARRWGNLYSILAVSNDMGRDLRVTHADSTMLLHPGDDPSFVFQGTPITGNWVIRAPMTEAEKKDLRLIPHGLKIRIIVKHL